ncbi:ribosome silencing factor [Paramicrobacterium agarici]|uniref:Ribosomal silencing factor RsfS n=1 Tax=Paramicrobacterium agarici TaxID=630514 RepID=A0A2A9DWV7_9MICO|nr:ribosome silencing factor [Microbacterium agarici]PFG31168.1 ribosome-associated protein [Microbacterium agarici]TQO24239.1 ribosome-associated protein [Microbacterium agarici]
MTATDETRSQVQIAAAAAQSVGAEDLVALDVSQQLPFVDAFLIVTGRSERNVGAVADAVEEKLGEAGTRVVRREGRAEGRWVLIDFGDIVVHVFHPEERDYYSLERLWRDCPVISLEEALAQ